MGHPPTKLASSFSDSVTDVCKDIKGRIYIHFIKRELSEARTSRGHLFFSFCFVTGLLEFVLPARNLHFQCTLQVFLIAFKS